LAEGGTGDIGSYTVSNTLPGPLTTSVTVVPSLDSCLGAPQSFNITVDTLAQIDQPATQILCNVVFTDGFE